MTPSSASPPTDIDRSDPRRDAVKRALFAEIGTRVGRTAIVRTTTRVLEAIDELDTPSSEDVVEPEPVNPLDERWGAALYESLRDYLGDLIPPWAELAEHNRAVYRRQGHHMRSSLVAGGDVVLARVPRPRTAEEQVADEAAERYERSFWARGER